VVRGLLAVSIKAHASANPRLESVKVPVTNVKNVKHESVACTHTKIKLANATGEKREKEHGPSWHPPSIACIIAIKSFLL